MQLLSCKNPELKDDFFPPAITHCVGKQTISHCSVYSTLSFTFCSEHTETLLEATAIFMQEAKENLVSDLIQDKSMCTHLLFIAPISSRRDTVLEFQGYPCCLCRRKTDLGDVLRALFKHFPGVQEGWESTKPWQVLMTLRTGFWERPHQVPISLLAFDRNSVSY